MKFALLSVIIICSSLFSFAQKPTSPVLEAKLIKEIALLIDKKKTIPLTELNKQLKNISGKKAKIPKVSPFVDDPKNLYELCKPSTLIVASLYKCGACTNWHSGSATGFPLTKDGIFATNYHVMGQPNGETLAVMDTEGNIFPVTDVLAGDEKSDVIILRAAGAKFRPLPLGDPAEIGSSVHVISHPDGTFYYYSKGMVSLYDEIEASNVPLTEWMVISADYARGSSGAAVLNDFGEVVGMVASTVTIHYEKQKMTNPQMVLRLCAPINAILKLIE